jgi:hypothetical protein
MSLKAQALASKTSSSRRFKTLIVLFVLTLLPLIKITVMQGGAQTVAADPGPRRGSAGAGGAFRGLNGGPGPEYRRADSLQPTPELPRQSASSACHPGGRYQHCPDLITVDGPVRETRFVLRTRWRVGRNILSMK